MIHMHKFSVLTPSHTYTKYRVGDLLAASGRARDAIPLDEVEALVKNAYALQARLHCSVGGGCIV